MVDKNEKQELKAFKKNIGNNISTIIKENLTPEDIKTLKKMRKDIQKET